MKYQMPFFFLGLVAVLTFQNCGDVTFTSDNGGSVVETESVNSPQDIEESEDVIGGHFDLDTATEVYADGKGTTNQHVHEYDDKNKTNVANFFNLIGKDFDNIQATVLPDQIFYLRIANGELSPRVSLEINGISYPMSMLQHGPFSLSGVSGTTKLTSLRALVATDAILNRGLVSTQTSCVRSNDFSADGRYRNGALVFQAISADQIAGIDANLGVASNNDALLWEAILFWHEDGGSCR